VRKTVTGILVLAFLLSCSTQKPITLEPNAPFTIRPVFMTDEDFVIAADSNVKDKVPEWHIDVSERSDVVLRVTWLMHAAFAETRESRPGIKTVTLWRRALVLATIEDLAYILLHEYVHVETWHLFDHMGLSKECNIYRDEMFANWIVIRNYRTLGYRRELLLHSVALYNRAHASAKYLLCPMATYAGIPRWPVPQRIQ